MFRDVSPSVIAIIAATLPSRTTARCSGLRHGKLLLAMMVLVALAAPARAADLPVVQLTIKDHRFIPEELHVAAGKAVMLDITNQDATAEEFDSAVMAIEKVIPPGGSGRVRLRPLAPGRYPFIGEYHAQSAHGVIISDAGN